MSAGHQCGNHSLNVSLDAADPAAGFNHDGDPHFTRAIHWQWKSGSDSEVGLQGITFGHSEQLRELGKQDQSKHGKRNVRKGKQKTPSIRVPAAKLDRASLAATQGT
jgi:hypothetical protein